MDLDQISQPSDRERYRWQIFLDTKTLEHRCRNLQLFILLFVLNAYCSFFLTHGTRKQQKNRPKWVLDRPTPLQTPINHHIWFPNGFSCYCSNARRLPWPSHDVNTFCWGVSVDPGRSYPILKATAYYPNIFTFIQLFPNTISNYLTIIK